MKKLFFVICAILIAASGFAQKDLISSVFEKYAGTDGITTVNMTGDMLKLITQAEMERRDTVFSSTLSEIRVLAVEDECEKPSGLNLKTEVYDKLDKSVYKEMLTVKQTNEDVVIMVKESEGRIKEMLVIVGGSKDNALIQIKGDMLLSELADMAGKYQMKGFEQLKKLDK
ncbi:MAG TPA: DUF4252 domain-containing protein [Bacteroidales bacterium]|jgi:hypothetical protein|nr:DUF4252 domain-containing protein [Bacteroidales bacterium]